MYMYFRFYSIKYGSIGLKKRTMYSILCLIVIVHLSMIGSWLIRGSVYSYLDYTNELLEYSRCFYPISKKIR